MFGMKGIRLGKVSRYVYVDLEFSKPSEAVATKEMYLANGNSWSLANLVEVSKTFTTQACFPEVASYLDVTSTLFSSKKELPVLVFKL